jgi:hypothetical protein
MDGMLSAKLLWPQRTHHLLSAFLHATLTCYSFAARTVKISSSVGIVLGETSRNKACL